MNDGRNFWHKKKNMKITKRNPLQSIVNDFLIDSPAAINISYFWSFGSLLGLNQVQMLITGILQAMHYTANTALAFNSVEHIMRDVNNGWLLRYFHANGASFFFIWVYLHIGRGLYYGSYRQPRSQLWIIGVIIFIQMMATAFIGYVQPWGQMSQWGECPSVYLQIGIIGKSSCSAKRIGPHNYDVISFIFGAILSDAHAERHGNGTRISQQQSSNNMEFLIWYHNFLAIRGYVNPNITKIQSRIGKNNKRIFYSKSVTYTYTSFNWQHDEFYPSKRVKVVPSNLNMYLSPIAQAVWIMGDGSSVSSGCKQSTNCFTKSECEFICKIQWDKYDIKASVNNAGVPNQWVVYIWKESMPKLKNIVKPYMVGSMQYKQGR